VLPLNPFQAYCGNLPQRHPYGYERAGAEGKIRFAYPPPAADPRRSSKVAGIFGPNTGSSSLESS
jgi:hypothetical protein